MPTHILLLGAHGKVSLQLLPLLLARSWSVTALIRDAAQTPDILNTRLSIPASSTQPGTLHVLVESLEDVRNPADASRIIARVKGCDCVVWAAGRTPFLVSFARCTCRNSES
jgi:putative NADH-flavin reductase